MTHRDYVLAAVNHRQADRIPYTLGFEDGTDLELDAFYGSTEWRAKVQNYLVGVAGINTTGEQAIDEVYARDAFGSLWRMDKRPWHLERPALAEPCFDAVEWPSSDHFAFAVWQDPGEAQDLYREYFTLCNCGWGLFEQSWRIRGFENVLMDIVMDPDFYEELLDRLTDLYLAHVARFKDIPADAVMFGDDWGDQRGVIIGPERWRQLLKPRWAKIYQAVHAQGKIAVHHSCGSVADILPDIIEIGLDVLESVQPEPAGMESFELKRRYGDKIAFWGCLGSQSTVAFATPDEVRGRINDLCRVMGQGGGYILAPAKSIQPGTPSANSAAVVEEFARQNL